MTTSAATIRALRAGEVDLWRNIRLRALRDAPDAFGTTYDEAASWPDEQWAKHVESATEPDATQAVYLAAVDETVVGCARVSREAESTTALITAMWVDPRARRQGIATALLEVCLARARARGCRAVELEVAESNPGARLLYERAGFVPTGKTSLLRDGSRARTVQMAKTLDAGTA